MTAQMAQMKNYVMVMPLAEKISFAVMTVCVSVLTKGAILLKNV